MQISILICLSLFSICLGTNDDFAEYYEEAEEASDGIICSSDAECPKHQPKCRENHCQPECFSSADCNEKICLNGKCVTKKIVTKERFIMRSGKHDKEKKDQRVSSEDDLDAEGRMMTEYHAEDGEYESTETDEFIQDDYEDYEDEKSSDIPEMIDPDEENYSDEIYEDEEHKNKTILDEYDDVVDQKTLEPKETTTLPTNSEDEKTPSGSKEVEVEVVELIDNEGKILKKENHTEATKSSTTTEDFDELVNDYIEEAPSIEDDDYLADYYDDDVENEPSKSMEEKVTYKQLFEISTIKPETLLGHYESPSGCDFQNVGSCQYALRYFKDPQGIRFVIEVKGVTCTDFGFAALQDSYMANSEYITVDEDFQVIEKLLDKHGHSQDKEGSDLQDAKATIIPEKNVLYVTFVKPLNSTDPKYVSIGASDGLFYYSDGPSQLKQLKKHEWLNNEQPINFNVLKTSTVKPRTTSEMTEEPENNQNHENTMPRKRKVWNNQKCHGSTKMLSSNGGFKTYLSCDNGILTTKSCPKGSIFYFAIQCCVSISEFPCKANCLGERGFFHNGGQQESHDYAYFHY